MADAKPVVYILRGDDELTINKHIADMVSKMGDPSLVDMNVTRLDGKTANEDDLRSAAFAMPFLAERRLVIVSNPLWRYTSRKGKGQSEEEQEETSPQADSKPSAIKAAQARLLALLDGLPETTALAMVVDDSLVRRGGVTVWETTTETHWLIKWARQAGHRALVIDCLMPTVDRMPDWIRTTAKTMGGQMSTQAARLLVEYIGCDTQLAAQEINKLLTYANYKRAIEEDDVILLTAQTAQVSVFDMVDALGERNPQRAIKLLHRLMEETEPQMLFGMIVRQFRLLLQAREIMDEGGGQADITNQLNQNFYVGKKLYEQCPNFNMPTLEAIYHRLLDFDLGMKTSQMTYEVAFDTFVAEVAAL